MDHKNTNDFVDPDGEHDYQFKWEEDFQRHVISLILLDRQFMLEAMDLVKPAYFTNKGHQTACSIAYDFFKKYSILPDKVFLQQEMKERLQKDKSLPYYLGEINVVYDYFQPGLEARDYLASKIEYFAKIMAVRTTFRDTVKLMQKEPESDETWGKIHEMWRQAMLVERNFDLGIDYFKSMKDRYDEANREADRLDRFVTGFKEAIDEQIGGGYSRGEIMAVVAASGVGKSVYLACLTALNIMRGKRGVFISCELRDKKVAERMDAIFTGLNIKTLEAFKNDVFARVEDMRRGQRTIHGLKDQRWYDNGLDEGNDISVAADGEFSPLVIKEFAAGAATVNTIRAYLTQLRFHGFTPDFVIIDYVGEMKDIPGLATHESRERIVRDLRGMAKEENVFVAIAVQPNRGGKEVQKEKYGRIDDTHFADSFGQIKPLDGAFSLMQNDAEKQQGVGRGYIIKQRDGKSRFMFYVAFDPESLRITEIHVDTYKNIMAAFSDTAAEETDMDSVKDVAAKKKRKKGLGVVKDFDAQLAEDAANTVDAAKEAQKKKMEERDKEENDKTS